MSTSKTRTTHQTASLIGDQCLAVRVRMLNRTITAIYDDALRPLGLTVGQLNILVVIARRGPVSPGNVARRLNMEKSTISRNIERMRKNGWVTVTAAGSGHRQDLNLTDQGRALLESSMPAWDEAQTQARALLGRSGADAIHRVSNSVWSRIGRE